jgi:transposase-like protein
MVAIGSSRILFVNFNLASGGLSLTVIRASPATGGLLKRVAVRMFIAGKTRTKISLELGTSRNTVNKWISKYQELGKIQN